METGPDSPTPAEAQRTLDQLGQDEDAVRYPPLPRRFFLVMAAVIVGLALAQFLPSPEVTLVMLGLTVIALLVASKFWLNRDGVSWASARFADMLPFLLGILGTFALSALISETTGAWWIWILGAAIMAGIVLRTGQNYRREYGE